MRTRAILAAVGVAAGALLTGCSSSGPRSAAEARATLRSDVLTLSRAAAAQNWPAANTALGQLRNDLSVARAAGGIDDAQLRALRAHIAAVAADLAAKTAPATTSAPPSSSARPSTRSTHKPAPAPKAPPKPANPPKHKHKHRGHGGDGGGGKD
jgi:hypothetical protein